MTLRLRKRFGGGNDGLGGDGPEPNGYHNENDRGNLYLQSFWPRYIVFSKTKYWDWLVAEAA